MKTSEDAVNDAVVNPASRLMILLFGTWLVGALYPIPETSSPVHMFFRSLNLNPVIDARSR